ncbi:DNA methyltransferase 2, putative [Eimeria brunetti]|uniref:DNA methyltransferase 2, putative n=1 Tax=Eimeria brunetti TaxID=51314 RepID=U6LP13_9EIME|nr:DNA methyltransferase 2, putative [Eimeria brunetti]
MTADSLRACSPAPDGSPSGLGGGPTSSGGPLWRGSPLRVFEFFSGIGGMRVGLTDALDSLRRRGTSGSPEAEVVGAYDVSETANRVYTHNFKASPICVSIEHLSLQQVDGKADLWLLSPPCQPYTRGGKKLDSKDGRARGFLHLLQLLGSCCSPPQFLFLENVRGFEGSETWTQMQQVLCSQQYSVQHFLLSPTQIGIPNTRVRYYCLACRRATQNPQRNLKNLVPEQGQQQHHQQQHHQQPEQQQQGMRVDQQQQKHGQQQEQQQRVQDQEKLDASLKLRVGTAELQLVPPVLSSGAPGALGEFQLRCIGDFLEESIPLEEQQALGIPAARLRRFTDGETEEEGRGGGQRKEKELKETVSGERPRYANRRDRKKPANSSDTDTGAGATEEEGEFTTRTSAQSPQNNGFRLEIVSPCHTACGTFTKGYGRNLHSGGPLLLVSKEQLVSRGPTEGGTATAAVPATEAAVAAAASETQGAAAATAEAALTAAAAAAVLSPETLERGRFRRRREGETVRFFSSRELLRLHGFPESFSFPPSLPFRKRAALVGNSVNVKVVALLLQHLLLQQHWQQMQQQPSPAEQLQEHPT